MKEIKTLTGLRGFAALWVVMFHFQYAMMPVARFYFQVFDNKLVQKGSLAVDIFFVLSGFVLAYAAREWQGEKPFSYTFNFLRSRLARIYPLHVATIIAMMFIIDLHRPGADVPAALLGHLALVHAWGHFYSPDFNYPSWSLSAEWAAYLLFPVLLFASRSLRRVPVIGFASCIAAFAALGLLGLKYNHGKCDFTFDFGWARCLAEFWIGLFIYQAYRFADSRWSSSTRNMWGLAALVAFAAQIRYAGIDVTIVPVSALLVFATSLQPMILQKLFANRGSYHLGEISFSVYMLHIPLAFTLLKWCTGNHPEWFANLWSGLAVVASIVALLLGVSSLTYRYFEMPMKRLLSRNGTMKRLAKSATSEAALKMRPSDAS